VCTLFFSCLLYYSFLVGLFYEIHDIYQEALTSPLIYSHESILKQRIPTTHLFNVWISQEPYVLKLNVLGLPRIGSIYMLTASVRMASLAQVITHDSPYLLCF
jgi:hypothetical protein